MSGSRIAGIVLAMLAVLAPPLACARSAAPVSVAPPAAGPRPTRAEVDATAAPSSPWSPALAAALAGHGDPHGPPLPLDRDSEGRQRWLAFVGTDEVALGAWRVTIGADGSGPVEPVTRWPTGVRVLGGIVRGGVPYVLLESLGVLDQPAGLRGVWVGGADHAPRAAPSPLALSGVSELKDIEARLDATPPPPASLERNAGTLLATLQAASTSTQTLQRALSAQGADIETAWQSLFTRTVGHLDAGAAPDRATVDQALALVRDVLETQACGVDACEAWTGRGRAVARFAQQDGRWGIRSLIEDAPATPSTPGHAPPRQVDASPGVEATAALLHARVKEPRQILGQAPLDADGGTLGVALTDASPDSPLVVIREGLAGRVFGLDVGPLRALVEDATWDAAFADVDGDGRTDVVLTMRGARADGTPLAWAQVFLAPPASVQVTSIAPDLASALAVMDAPDAREAARAASAMPTKAVTRDEACQVLASATTLAGFRRVATPGARLLLFQEPGRPTWRPKIVPLAKIAAGDVHGFGAHCAEMICDKTRPYCSYTVPGDALHVWFSWSSAGHLVIDGVADYSGE